MPNHSRLRAITISLLIAVIVLYAITGFGIIQYKIVEAMTYGILSKGRSVTIHNYLIFPGIIVLAMHIFLSLRLRAQIQKQQNKA